MFFTAWIASVARGARREEGQGLVEYSLVLFLLSLVGLVVLMSVGNPVLNMLQQVADALT